MPWFDRNNIIKWMWASERAWAPELKFNLSICNNGNGTHRTCGHWSSPSPSISEITNNKSRDKINKFKNKWFFAAQTNPIRRNRPKQRQAILCNAAKRRKLSGFPMNWYRASHQQHHYCSGCHRAHQTRITKAWTTKKVIFVRYVAPALPSSTPLPPQ